MLWLHCDVANYWCFGYTMLLQCCDCIAIWSIIGVSVTPCYYNAVTALRFGQLLVFRLHHAITMLWLHCDLVNYWCFGYTMLLQCCDCIAIWSIIGVSVTPCYYNAVTALRFGQLLVFRLHHAITMLLLHCDLVNYWCFGYTMLLQCCDCIAIWSIIGVSVTPCYYNAVTALQCGQLLFFRWHNNMTMLWFHCDVVNYLCFGDTMLWQCCDLIVVWSIISVSVTTCYDKAVISLWCGQLLVFRWHHAMTMLWPHCDVVYLGFFHTTLRHHCDITVMWLTGGITTSYIIVYMTTQKPLCDVIN